MELSRQPLAALLASDVQSFTLRDVIREKAAMLSKCANPPCSASFRYFRQGKLFRVEIEPSGIVPTAKTAGRSEFFWLCDDCASHLTLEYDHQTGVVVKRLDGELRAAS
jgi:hypothetical protein